MRSIRVWTGVLIVWRKKGHELLRARPLYSHEWECLLDKRRLMPELALPNGAMAGWTVVDIAACATVLASGLPLHRGCPRCGVVAPIWRLDEPGKSLPGKQLGCSLVMYSIQIPYPCGRLPINFVRNQKAFNGALREQRVGTQP
jgi:hypothetical protein